MKGVTCEKAGAGYKIVDDLEVPEPGPDQILVKSHYAAINPVDSLMSEKGALVKEWPLVPGIDVAGVVEKVGEKASASFKVGDPVCGCTRIGVRGYSACQEYLLMYASVAMPLPKGVALRQAATIGVGLFTASLGLFDGLDIPFPSTSENAELKDEWVVVLGGSGSVGKFAIQLLKICGYKVAASCSSNNASLVKKQGADEIFDYKTPVSEQIKEILAITKGNVHRVFDAAATGDELAKELFKALKEPKFFSSTNTWSNIADFDGVRTRVVELGPIGTPEGEDINGKIRAYLPTLVEMFEKEILHPSPYDEVGKGGFEDVLDALRYQKKGAGGANKVVVQVQPVEKAGDFLV
ncbi:hypothetical protein FQN54_003308 [Arachnomyces sp. PD_36]|nr:hypothetical protein FQN54_003308 [Arachnomyces sp. PD_36]